MEKKDCILLNYFNIIQDYLCFLESLIKLTKSSCLEKEMNSSYYDLSKNNKLQLSEERNNYINVLSITLEKLEELKKICFELEEKHSVL